MKFFGINLLENFNVYIIGQVKFEQPWQHFTRHSIEEYVIYFIKEGEMFIEEDGIKYHLKKGELFILEPNKVHTGYAAASVQYYFIHIKDLSFNTFEYKNVEHLVDSIEQRRNLAITSNIKPEAYNQDSMCILPKHYAFKHYYDTIHLLNKVCYELNHKDENFKIYCVLLTKQILIQLNRQFNLDTIDPLKEQSRAYVKKLMSFLEESISKQLKIEDIADYMELNYDYLNRLFKTRTNYTIKNYFNLLKIQHAQKLIRETNLTFTDIGLEIGIEDPFYFSKFFKERTGLSPSQYKNEVYIEN